MDSAAPDAKRYLLGQMDESDASIFEEHFFADDELYERVTSAESDLIDSFVRGELSKEEERQIREGYLISADRRANVEFTRALANHLAKTVYQDTPIMSQGSSVWKSARYFKSFTAWPERLAWALLALILISGASSIILQGRRQMRIRAIESQNRQLELQQQIASLRTQLKNRNSSDAGSGRPITQPPGPELISFSLTPGLERGSAGAKTLRVLPSVLVVRVQLYLEHDDYHGYAAVLETGDGRHLWRKGALKSQPRPNGIRAITFGMPGYLFRPGDYLIKLSAEATRGTTEEVGDYRFSVASAILNGGSGRR